MRKTIYLLLIQFAFVLLTLKKIISLKILFIWI